MAITRRSLLFTGAAAALSAKALTSAADAQQQPRRPGAPTPPATPQPAIVDPVYNELLIPNTTMAYLAARGDRPLTGLAKLVLLMDAANRAEQENFMRVLNTEIAQPTAQHDRFAAQVIDVLKIRYAENSAQCWERRDVMLFHVMRSLDAIEAPFIRAEMNSADRRNRDSVTFGRIVPGLTSTSPELAPMMEHLRRNPNETLAARSTCGNTIAAGTDLAQEQNVLNALKRGNFTLALILARRDHDNGERTSPISAVVMAFDAMNRQDSQGMRDALKIDTTPQNPTEQIFQLIKEDMEKRIAVPIALRRSRTPDFSWDNRGHSAGQFFGAILSAYEDNAEITRARRSAAETQAMITFRETMAGFANAAPDIKNTINAQILPGMLPPQSAQQPTAGPQIAAPRPQ